jgi:hypothetical protein
MYALCVRVRLFAFSSWIFFLSPLLVLDIFLRRTDSEWYELREKIMFVVGWERLFLDSVKGMGVKKMVGELALKTFVSFLVLRARARVCNLKFWGCVCRRRRMFWKTIC